jgi:hypothetical protein
MDSFVHLHRCSNRKCQKSVAVDYKREVVLGVDKVEWTCKHCQLTQRTAVEQESPFSDGLGQMQRNAVPGTVISPKAQG